MKKLVIMVLLLAVTIGYADVFVINSTSETISKIDLENGDVDNAFCVTGSMPNRLAFWENKIYVVNSGDNNLGIFDVETGESLGSIFIEDSANPYDIEIVENYAFVTAALTNKLYKVNLETEQVVDELVVGNNPAGVHYFGSKIYVGNADYTNNYAASSVSIIDFDTFTIEATVATSANPQYISDVNGDIHVSCGGNWASIFGKIEIIDAETNEITTTLDLGGIPSNFAMFNENIYLGDAMGSGIYSYNPSTFEILNSSSNPIVPGAQLVSTFEDKFLTLSGNWGENFAVKVFDSAFEELAQYEVGLTGTDLKVYNANTSNENETIEITSHSFNYPNPFNPTTTISYSLENSSNVQLNIYNLKGQLVKTLQNSHQEKGTHSVVWNGKDDRGNSVGSGVYFYKIQTNNFNEIQKMILMK